MSIAVSLRGAVDTESATWWLLLPLPLVGGPWSEVSGGAAPTLVRA